MKILNVNDFISERMNIVPISNDELEISAKPKERLENVEDFKYWLMYYKYEFEEQESCHREGGINLAIKDKKRPNYTIHFDFVGTSPKAYEFLYFIDKDGLEDNFYWDSSTHEIDSIREIPKYWLDVKESYKHRVVEWRKKQLRKAELEYKKEYKKDWRYASDYKVKEQRAKLEKVMDKYNSI